MAFLEVTFGRGLGSPPVMVGRGRRTERLTIDEAATDNPPVTEMVCDTGGRESENIADLVAGADCYVSIGPDPDAEVPAAANSESWFMKSGERLQFAIRAGDRVSVVAAA
jgi:hypothetical protein